MDTAIFPEPRHLRVDGVTIRFADTEGPHGRTVVLTSPWPESIYAFAPVWGLLAPHVRLIAVDLPGFGRSDYSERLMTPRRMGEFLVRFIGELGLDRPYVVGPDVGTAAALSAAAASPHTIAGLVVGAGATALPIQLGEPLASWVLDRDYAKYREVDPQLIVDAALQNNGTRVSEAIRADYLASNAGTRFFDSMRYARSYPTELPVLAEALATITTPVTIVSAQHDSVVPPVNAQFLHDRMPHSRLVSLDSGHFAWEQTPVEYVGVILDAVGGAGSAGD